MVLPVVMRCRRGDLAVAFEHAQPGGQGGTR